MHEMKIKIVGISFPFRFSPIQTYTGLLGSTVVLPIGGVTGEPGRIGLPGELGDVGGVRDVMVTDGFFNCPNDSTEARLDK